jgi:hypothetical protein
MWEGVVMFKASLGKLFGKPLSKIIRTKMDWRCDLSNRAPALQVQGITKVKKEIKEERKKERRKKTRNKPKEVKDLYNETITEKETEEDSRRWKDLPCSWISKTNNVKMAIFQKHSADSMQFPLIFPHHSSKI